MGVGALARPVHGGTGGAGLVVAVRDCALDGCGNSVEVTRTEGRRYCCVAHRKMARNARRAVISPPPARRTILHQTPSAPAPMPADPTPAPERPPVFVPEPGKPLPSPEEVHERVREIFASAREAAPTQPAPEPATPIQPAPIQPAPTPIQPAPTPIQPAPTPIQPAPTPIQPAPAAWSPEPADARPPVPVGFGTGRDARAADPGAPAKKTETLIGRLVGALRAGLVAVHLLVSTAGARLGAVTGRGRAAWTDKRAAKAERSKDAAKKGAISPVRARLRAAKTGLGRLLAPVGAVTAPLARIVPLNLREAWAAALSSLAANRLRSFLTTVGIIAGVASVIMLVAMGDGMTKGFDDQWSRLATQITITPITGAKAVSKAPQKLTDADLKALKNPRNTPHVATWSPAVASNRVTVAAGQKKAGSQLYGISQNYLELTNRHLKAGVWFTDQQIKDADRRAVIGLQVVNDLWGSDADLDALLGQTIRVGTGNFEIQGVVDTDGQNDNLIMVPLEAARAYVMGNDGDKLTAIIAKSTSKDTLEQAKYEIFQVLYQQHKVRESVDRDFNVTDYKNILDEQRKSIKFMSMFIVVIAAISLFVGGVGVANIMLVSVTERTREIGIRKAIGAPRGAIMRQFLSEAVMLTALGGAVGVVLGIGVCLAGEKIIPEIWPPDTGSLTPTPVPLLSASPVFVAFGVSVVIGLLAGGYPAYRAAKMRPIDALRHQ